MKIDVPVRLITTDETAPQKVGITMKSLDFQFYLDKFAWTMMRPKGGTKIFKFFC